MQNKAIDDNSGTGLMLPMPALNSKA